MPAGYILQNCDFLIQVQWADQVALLSLGSGLEMTNSEVLDWYVYSPDTMVIFTRYSEREEYRKGLSRVCSYHQINNYWSSGFLN